MKNLIPDMEIVLIYSWIISQWDARMEKIEKPVESKTKSNQEYKKEDDFIKVLEARIGHEETIKYRSLILKHVDTSHQYLQIFLSGCMFHSLISDDCQQATVYSQAIKEIIRSGKLSLSLDEKEIERILEEKYEKVLKCWTSQEYANKPAPLDTFYNWSKTEKETKANKDILVSELTEDALRYLKLVAVWDNFVKAFEGLGLLWNKR